MTTKTSTITRLLRSDSVRRGARTFLISFLVVLVPGALGWLNALTSWASSEGQTPFPDAHSLAYLGVSAIVAGVIALGNLLWNWVEDATGKGLLRQIPATPAKKATRKKAS